MPSPTFIGRAAEDLLTTATAATTAATGTSDTKTATTQASQATRDEIDDATAKLQRHFDQVAGEFRTQITQFTTTVRNSDWEGTAKTSALELAETFRTRLDTLMTTTTERITDFKTWMLSSADTFNEDVKVKLGALLDGYGEQYAGLSKVVTDYNAQMDAVEQTGSAKFAQA